MEKRRALEWKRRRPKETNREAADGALSGGAGRRDEEEEHPRGCTAKQKAANGEKGSWGKDAAGGEANSE